MSFLLCSPSVCLDSCRLVYSIPALIVTILIDEILAKAHAPRTLSAMDTVKASEKVINLKGSVVWTHL